ncbi:dihydroneopterin aldolase [Paraburkholderia rhizosphaerae]|nr:dihydroneopterin aldolase [Paraburkholderia rhizosphaerae]
MNERFAADDALTRVPARVALDIVYIEGFTGQTVIGIDAPELHTTQPVRLDLAIGVPRLRACDTDRIGDTVDYSAVRTALHTLLATHKVQLLEALAEQVAQLIIGTFGAHWVRVSLSKPAKFDDVTAVGVLIERTRTRSEARSLWGRCASLGEGLIPD